MKIITCECTCNPEEPYVDGSKPSFYDNEKKAIYMYARLKLKAGIWSASERITYFEC